MLQSKSKVVKSIEGMIRARCMGKRTETEYAQNLIKKLYEEYNMPLGKAGMIVSLKVGLDTLSEFELFCVLSQLEPKKVKEYYTETEIKNYSASKFSSTAIHFPLKFKVVKITDEQYIGCISAQTLKALDTAGLINYNENTQRTMKHIIKGEKEYYQIALNQIAVGNICDLMRSGTYISDDITLNISTEDETANFSYDESTCEMTIKSIKSFDALCL